MDINYGLLFGLIEILLFFVIFKYYYYTYFLANIRLHHYSNGNIEESENELPNYSEIITTTEPELPSYNEAITNIN